MVPLYDKVYAERNLLAASHEWRRRRRGGGRSRDRDAFERGLPETLWEVSDQLKHGTYQPQSIRRVHIPKPGTNETRPLGIPTVRDRVVQAAVVNVIEPIFDVTSPSTATGSARDAAARTPCDASMGS